MGSCLEFNKEENDEIMAENKAWNSRTIVKRTSVHKQVSFLKNKLKGLQREWPNACCIYWLTHTCPLMLVPFPVPLGQLYALFALSSASVFSTL